MHLRKASLAAAIVAGACSAAGLDDSRDGGWGAGLDGGALDPDGQAPIAVDAAPAPDADPADGIGYSEARFASTHNSYSGDIGGARGTILAQLEAGVRNLELDVHARGSGETFAYRIGHNDPGGEVDHGGDNPGDDNLESWLAIVANWSAQNPRHAPITLVIDLKTDLGIRKSYDEGEPARLNDVLAAAFGDRLLWAEDVGASFPTISELRGRILAVMSGSQNTRLAYRRDRGSNPGVAVNAHGHVIEVHDAGGGLWYWTGVIEGERVRWMRHGEYDTGRNPAVALSDDGLIVEVHNAPNPTVGSDFTLFYRVGELRDDFEISWFHDGGLRFPNDDSGTNPTIRFVDRGGLTVRELHQSENTGNHFFWDGEIDVSAGEVVWTRHGTNGATDDPLHIKTADATGAHAIEISLGPIAPYGADTLRYRLHGGAWSPVRYPQLLFVEVQHNGDAALEADDLWFYAASAESAAGRDWAQDRRSEGGAVRLWNFNSPDYQTRVPVNFPATDLPYETWYQSYCADCLQ
jgi:hypothetical protein